MRNPLAWLAVAVGAVPLLLLAVVAASIWSGVPPELDPEALPSRELESPSAAYGETIETGRSLARALTADEKLPGLSLAVAVDGEIVWAEGFGWAELESGIPVTPATLFRIGGVSATLTAAAVGLLVDRGHLDLDEPVRHYLADFPQKEWPFTTRQLMAHTAGIRAHRGEGGIFRGVCADDAERLELFAEEPLRARPRTEYHYSTYGWSLVAAVVSATAGEPYLGFLRREILEPLGMDDTVTDIAAHAEATRAEAPRAHLYYPRFMLDPWYGLQDAPEVDLSCHLPAVGFLSTPSDLARFGAAMMDASLLSPTTVDELQSPVRLDSGEPTGQALGWTVESVPMGPDATETRVAGQGLGEAVLGSFLGVSTVGGQVAGGTMSLLTVPEHRIAIAVSSNVSGAGNVYTLAARLADLFVRRLDPPGRSD